MAGPFSNLADKFREIEDDIKRNTNFPPTPPQQQSPDVSSATEIVNKKPVSRLAEKISDTNPQTTDFSLSMEYRNFYGGGTTITGKLATGEHSGVKSYDREMVTVRKVDLSKLGTAGKLGFGDLTLESLYDVNHKNNPNRKPIDIGRKDFDGNSLLINTTRAGMGDLNALDIKKYSTNEIFYRGVDRGNEPYQIAKIGTDDAFYGRDKHVSRLIKFYKSKAGQQTLLKENLLSFLFMPKKVDLKNLKLPAISSVLGSTFQKLIGLSLRRGHHNLFANLGFQSADLSVKDKELTTVAGQTISLGQLGDLGNVLGSLRRPFAIEYSARKRTGMPYGDLGDRPWNLSILRLLPVAETRGSVVDGEYKKFDKLRSGLAKNYNKLVQKGIDESNRIRNQLTLKVTPFIDLSGGPANHSDSYQIGLLGPKRLHGYDDKLSGWESTSIPGAVDNTDFDASTKSGKITEFEEPPLERQNKIRQGDFYVRFKDLRDDRYLYFRGYVTGITENLSPSWTTTEYVGRSEPVYSYQRAERDISFNLAVYPQNFEDEQAMYRKINRLSSLVYPDYIPSKSSLLRMKPPFTEMYMAHIGTQKKGQFGYIKSLSYTVNESGDWNAFQNLPRVFSIAISYQIVSKTPPQLGDEHYMGWYGNKGEPRGKRG